MTVMSNITDISVKGRVWPAVESGENGEDGSWAAELGDSCDCRIANEQRRERLLTV